MGEILDEEVGEGVDGGLDTDFVVLAAKLVGQKNQAAGAGHELFVFCALAPADRFLMNLARQDACLEQLVGGVEVEVVGRDNMPQWVIQIGLNDLVRHAQLVAELAVGAGLIQDPEGVLPETAAHWQDGIVLGKMGNVLLAVANGRARQMPGDFAQVGLHDLLDGRFGFRLFRQNDLANDCIDVGIGEFHADGEATFEFFQVAGTAHGCLTSTDEQEFAADVFAASFHRLLDVDGALAVFADVLLHLIEHDEGQGEFATFGQGLANGFEHVIAGDVLHVGVEIVQGLDAGYG